jgi:hypothetical protein
MTARFNRIMSSSARWPIRAPTLAFGMVVILSTINRETVCNPFVSRGAIGNRSVLQIGNAIDKILVLIGTRYRIEPAG